MSNQEPTQPQNSTSSGGSEENPNQAGDAATENITRGMANMNTQDRSIRELINQLGELPVVSVESFKVLDQKLRNDNVLREELELSLYLFFKEAKSVYSFLRRATSKLITKEVAKQFTRTDPPPGKKSFEREVPTTYKMIIDAAERYKVLYNTSDNITREFGSVLSNTKDWKPPARYA
ncbi:uncharacterized protein [Parasteatoda tepidariorum]|uniref:uncharacterized protein n=1 Tax=Parasteatoda tepidariorum TaxID=114398 RepID=UPI001C71C959|nr:uncharacterized protein LOC107437016 [Parasteatoda tepidariorum]